jgi:hypothetical protein
MLELDQLVFESDVLTDYEDEEDDEDDFEKYGYTEADRNTLQP